MQFPFKFDFSKVGDVYHIPEETSTVSILTIISIGKPLYKKFFIDMSKRDIAEYVINDTDFHNTALKYILCLRKFAIECGVFNLSDTYYRTIERLKEYITKEDPVTVFNKICNVFDFKPDVKGVISGML